MATYSYVGIITGDRIAPYIRKLSATQQSPTPPLTDD